MIKEKKNFQKKPNVPTEKQKLVDDIQRLNQIN